MGQRVQGVVFGVIPTEKQWEAFCDEDGDVDLYEEIGFRVEQGDDDEVRLLGVAIAVQDVGDDDEMDIPTCRVADLPRAFPLTAAKKKWKAIVKWAKGKGVTLDDPELFLVRVERA